MFSHGVTQKRQKVHFYVGKQTAPQKGTAQPGSLLNADTSG